MFIAISFGVHLLKQWPFKLYILLIIFLVIFVKSMTQWGWGINYANNKKVCVILDLYVFFYIKIWLIKLILKIVKRDYTFITNIIYHFLSCINPVVACVYTVISCVNLLVSCKHQTISFAGIVLAYKNMYICWIYYVSLKKNKKPTHISLNCVTIILLQLMKPERTFLRYYLARSIPVLK